MLHLILQKQTVRFKSLVIGSIHPIQEYFDLLLGALAPLVTDLPAHQALTKLCLDRGPGTIPGINVNVVVVELQKKTDRSPLGYQSPC
jgi:hypothetical protein